MAIFIGKLPAHLSLNPAAVSVVALDQIRGTITIGKGAVGAYAQRRIKGDYYFEIRGRHHQVAGIGGTLEGAIADAVERHAEALKEFGE